MNIYNYEIRFILLSEGISGIKEDDRVKGIMDVLIISFAIRYDTLAMYDNTRLQEVHNSKNI
ncbi:HTH domain-containing protein [Clostridium beijerinckii]|uniref:Uncharacterized protein n=1 Tax=Clostridium beijerinckii TaxID=1520 RepID=A0A7X9SST0_CLOBE|nr:HTH domain-containing protein [Clostridium beijerinckii]NMF07389.1 hypothetical protein [Clostridium beijerinckii]